MFEDSRLITFGCSLTFGHGLEDCYNYETREPGPNPSKFAYPNIVKDKLGFKELINLSKCGASNKYIAEQVISFDFLQNDVILIQWSFIERWHWWVDMQDNKQVHLGPWQKGKLAKDFYKYYWDEETSAIDNALVIDYTHLYLEKLDNKFYTMIGSNTVKAPVQHAKFLPCVFSEHRGVDLALDKSHPGPKAHKTFAEELIIETEGFTI